jgi:hypothetical protein
MKTTLKLALALSLFCSVALGDGNQGSGNRDCPPEGCPPPCTENCGSQVVLTDTESDSFIDDVYETVEDLIEDYLLTGF